MSWKTRLRPASFRGVPFKVDTMGGAGGRRLVVTEYPKRDVPSAEDMGRQGRRYTFNVYVLGEDYEAARDKLIEALETLGSGTLVHPTIGNIEVKAGDFSYEETKNDGGMCRFALSFVEAGDNLYPAATTDTKAGVAGAARQAKADLTTAFDQGFSLAGQPGFLLDDAAAKVSDLAALLGGLRTGVQGTEGSLTAARTAFSVLLASVMDNPENHVVSGLPATVQSLLSGFRSISSDEAAQAGLRDVADYAETLQSPPATTPSRLQQAQNTAALSTLIAGSALVERALLASTIELASYDDAAALRRRLTGDLDGAAVAAADRDDDISFRTLRRLASAVSADLTARGGSLARLITFERPRPLPAAVMAYQLYGDAARADELLIRNKAAHPLFLPATGQALNA
tara:strand:+ start:138 stop:1337 length:1200 start_codon:yes stop_codon:yes gene_type:complete